MKKYGFSGFVSGVVFTMIIFVFAVPALAASFSRTATLEYNDIKITINGTVMTPKDANGNVVEPFIIDGTTYLPVRAVSGAFGYDVAWNDSTKTVTLSEQVVVPNSYTLSTGDYVVGVDIPAGKYDVTAISSSGNFVVHYVDDRLYINELMAAPGAASSSYYIDTYTNATFTDGMTLNISGPTLKFTAK